MVRVLVYGTRKTAKRGECLFSVTQCHPQVLLSAYLRRSCGSHIASKVDHCLLCESRQKKKKAKRDHCIFRSVILGIPVHTDNLLLRNQSDQPAVLFPSLPCTRPLFERFLSIISHRLTCRSCGYAIRSCRYYKKKINYQIQSVPYRWMMKTYGEHTNISGRSGYTNESRS